MGAGAGGGANSDQEKHFEGQDSQRIIRPGDVAALRRQRYGRAEEPPRPRGITRYQVAQMLEEKVKHFRETQARLKVLLEQKVKILPPVKLPRRRKTLWDFLVDEMRLMSTDFNEERKLFTHLSRGIARRAATARRELCEGRPESRDGRVEDAGASIQRHLAQLRAQTSAGGGLGTGAAAGAGAGGVESMDVDEG
ncbi:unnamed protein product, partial [Discosporangium mesarthrocarpum]